MMTRTLSAVFAIAIGASGSSVGAEYQGDPSTFHPSRTSEMRSLDYTDDWHVRIDAPDGKQFCFPAGEHFFSAGFYVPLPTVRCEDVVANAFPPLVHISIHPNAIDDLWESLREGCAKSPNGREDESLIDIKFADLGQIKGLRAQQCVRIYRATERDPGGYYVKGVTLINGNADELRGAHYSISATGGIQYRAQLDALLNEVLKGVHPTPVPK
jgi:hypothetical protein